MGRMNTKENGGRGFGGKGFYAALALCLVGTGVTAWIAVNSTVKDLEEAPESKSLEPLTSNADTLTPQEILDLNREAESQWSSPSLQEADTKSDDVPVTSKADTQDSSSTASSSAQSSDSSSVSTESAGEPAQSVSSQNVLYMLPVSGDIIGTFSGGELVKNPTMGDWRTHDGIDIKAAKGTEVKSVCDGKVTTVHDDPLMGMTIEVLHENDITSVYCGLAKEVSVKEGDAVKVGQVIGTVGEIPAEIALDPHLHFAMRSTNQWVDPLKTMGKVSG